MLFGVKGLEGVAWDLKRHGMSPSFVPFSLSGQEGEPMTRPIDLLLSLQYHNLCYGQPRQQQDDDKQDLPIDYSYPNMTDAQTSSTHPQSLPTFAFLSQHHLPMESHHDIVASFTQPSHPMTSYHPVDIGSIVHSPTTSTPDLPTTLPPLHPTSLTSLHPSLSTKKPNGFTKGQERAPWTSEEDNLLRLAVQLYGDKTEKWAKIAACVPGRTNKNCRKRWFHSLDPSLRKGTWTDEEDQLLREGVTKYPNQWSKIADMLEGRTDDQCAKRWRESLDPSIDRSDWSAEEDARLMEKYDLFGSQWQRIAQFFDGRPGLHCRNRWRKLQRMVQIKKQKESVATSTATSSFVNGLADQHYTRFQTPDASPPLSSPHSHNHAHAHANSNTHSHPQNQTQTHAPPLPLSSMLQDPSVLAQFSSSLSRVEDPHSDHSPYGCDMAGCYATFPQSSGLFLHMKTIHPCLDGIEKPYRCAMPNCAKRYKNINGLQYHLREAKGSSSHAVPDENSTSNSGSGSNTGPGSLNSRERPHHCQILGCKKSYRTPNGLRYHQQHGHNIIAPLSIDIQHRPHMPVGELRMRHDKWMDEVRSGF
ncbi:hypothetical protein F4703DRAFT_1797256 [Phycomyces blakesleeanus]